MNLPHTKDGHIDYKTLGNMIAATLLGEVFYGANVDFEHWSYPNEQESSPWQFYYKEDDVVVLRKKVNNSKINSFMGRGVIEAPIDQVASYLHKFQNRLEWDNMAVQVEVCQQYTENDWLIYMAHEAKNCLVKSCRDLLFYSRTAYIDSKYVQSSMSIEDKDYPHRPPYIRGEIKAGTGWVVEKYNGSECTSLVSYVANVDFKQLPSVIINRVLRRQPMAIKHIREKISMRSTKIPNSIPILPMLMSDEPMETFSFNASDFSDCYEEPVSVDNFLIQTPDKEQEQKQDSKDRANDELYPWIQEYREKRRQTVNGSDDKVHNGDKLLQHEDDTTASTNYGSCSSNSTRPRLYSNSLPDGLDITEVPVISKVVSVVEDETRQGTNYIDISTWYGAR
jgi:hypothetical protein